VTSQSQTWDGVTGMPAGFADGTDNNTTYSAGTGLRLSGTSFSLDNGYTDGRYWKRSGNSGTNPATHFLGTTDEQALEFRVNNSRVLRLEPHEGSPNVIAGHSNNSVGEDTCGATIGGGGLADYPNRAFGEFSTVGGGGDNQASADSSTVGGGGGNRASGHSSTVGGGSSNHAAQYGSTVGGGLLNQASGHRSTVAGGAYNEASGADSALGGGYDNEASAENSTVAGGASNVASGVRSTVGGGYSNVAQGVYSCVPGGYQCSAEGHYSFAAGSRAKALHDGAFVWADSPAGSGDFASTAEDQFLVRADGGVKIICDKDTFATRDAALQIESGALEGEGASINLDDGSNTDPVLQLLRRGSSGNFIEGKAGMWQLPKFHIDASGAFVTGSDLAESLPTVGNLTDYEAGDVLVISTQHPGGVERCSQPYHTAVIGVYSTRPGLLGADKDGHTEIGPNEIPVAIVGVAPTKVSAENGPIQPGDLLTTSSTSGHAMKAGPNPPIGTILGKAMGVLSEGTGVMKALVTLQ
jgi:hypothetical protein